MTAWTADELTRIGEAEELEVAPLRADGSAGRPLPVWVVRVGDDLYVPPMVSAQARATTLKLVPTARGRNA